MLQDQNRAAQQRYRERQKEKLQQTQQRVQELTAEINRFQIQKASRAAAVYHASLLTTHRGSMNLSSWRLQESLAARNALLEKYMAMQELQARSFALCIAEAASLLSAATSRDLPLGAGS